MIDVLVEPLTTYAFFRLALVASVAVGVGSAVLSCLLVVRHQALVGDAVSHSVLLGVAPRPGAWPPGDGSLTWRQTTTRRSSSPGRGPTA